ncbi:MAG: hypothetical protein K2X73_09460 [Sphingomonas sp.]|jgi:hypothetical protein|uniref:hypothetical protein n=1 Tax=Sphingomonas sp. TaxID=28214 RepID=UPI0025D6DA8A|nr:hypothetical protein [Sphingomonas sp.]MBX9882186.1 hypothetical protein [Sphingomonas sp.]
MRVALLLCLSLLPAPLAAQFAPRNGPPIDLPRRPIDIRTTPPEPGPWQDLRETRDVIRRERDAGRLTRGEARAFRREAWAIDALADRYGADGLSASEAQELENRARVLRDMAQAPRRR